MNRCVANLWQALELAAAAAISKVVGSIEDGVRITNVKRQVAQIPEPAPKRSKKKQAADVRAATLRTIVGITQYLTTAPSKVRQVLR